MLKILRDIVFGVVVLVVVLVAGGLGYRAIQKSRAAPELAIETPAGIDEARHVQASSALIEDVLWGAEMAEVDSEFAMPVFIIQGTEDRITPSAAARTHFECINAPTKELFPIDGAGHYAAMTHTEAFLDALTSTVLPAAEAHADTRGSRRRPGATTAR